MNKIFVFLLFSQIAFSKTYSMTVEPFYDELEGQSLIEALIKDQKISAAQDQIFKLANSDSYKLLAQAQVYNLQKKSESVLLLLKEKNLSNDLKIELARAQFDLKNFSECSEVIEPLHDQLLNQHPGIFYDCFFHSKKWDSAYRLASSKDDIEHLQLQWKWLISFQLFSVAKLKLIQWTEKVFVDDELVLKFLNELPSFERSTTLEILKMMRPDSASILAEWSENEFKNNRFLSATAGFQKVSGVNSDYLFAASELLRSRGLYQQARYLSQMDSQVENQLKSKISMAIDQNAYFQISGLAGPFERSELIKDQDIVYAFVYSLSPLRPEKAKYLSSFIRRSDLKQKVDQLRIQKF